MSLATTLVSALSSDVLARNTVLGVVVAVLMVVRGVCKRSLAPSGAVAALVVGTLSMLPGVRFGATLIVFFLTSSAVTRVGAATKKRIEDEYREGGQRNWRQVVANAGVGSALACALALVAHGDDRALSASSSSSSLTQLRLTAAYFAHYCCVQGDTWSSEIGVLSTRRPRLVLAPWRAVPSGTNGGVTALGLAAAAAGALVLGVAFAACGALFTVDGAWQWRVVALAPVFGVVGSLVDSALGATLQYSGFDERASRVRNTPSAHTRRIGVGVDVLSNDAVNFWSSVLTAALAAAFAEHCFP